MATRRSRRWWWLVLGVVAATIVLAVVLVRVLLFRDTTTAVGTDEALARYRASTTTAAAAATTAIPVTTVVAVAPLTLPDLGVYHYTTRGSEHIDALGGTTHNYPAVTTITVTPDGCGVQVRWDALKERWNTRRLCLAEGNIVLDTYSDFHQFFGQDDRTDWTCAPPYVVLPAAPGQRASWTGSCTDGAGTQEATSVSVLGLENVDVGGQALAAVHVQRVEKDTATNGTALSTTDQWLDSHSGLTLKEVGSSSSTTASPIGDVHYTEQYELVLTTRTPEH